MKKHYSAYGEKPKCRLHFEDRSLTKQANKKECDINFIISKFQKTGLINHVRNHEGQYAEFESIDYHTALNTIIEAQTMFDSIPSNIRAEFNNDPGKFVEFATNPENAQALYDLGLSETPPSLPDTPIQENNAPIEQTTPE